MPSALQPLARLLIVALEATFSYLVWAVHTINADYEMSDICPWVLRTLETDGTCSRCDLTEMVSGDHRLTLEQLEINAAKLKERRVAQQAVISRR